MKTKLLYALLPLLLLTGCDSSLASSTSMISINSTTSSTSTESTSSTYSTTSSSTTSSTSTNSTSSTSSTSVNPHTGDDWFEGRTLLECGYYSMDLPSNHSNPIELKTSVSAADWLNYSTKSELPDGFRFIYKNACSDGVTGHYINVVNNMYANEAGGIKFTDPGFGIQSPMFVHSGEKLEIRIGISQVNNAKGTIEDKKDTLHIYMFDNAGNLLGKEVVAKGSIDSKTTELKIYSATSYTKNIAYFDIRENAKPFKSSQCYNFGIGHINIHSWTYA